MDGGLDEMHDPLRVSRSMAPWRLLSPGTPRSGGCPAPGWELSLAFSREAEASFYSPEAREPPPPYAHRTQFVEARATSARGGLQVPCVVVPISRRYPIHPSIPPSVHADLSKSRALGQLEYLQAARTVRTSGTQRGPDRWRNFPQAPQGAQQPTVPECSVG